MLITDRIRLFSILLYNSSSGTYGSRSAGYRPVSNSNIKSGSYNVRAKKFINTSTSYDIIGESYDKYIKRIQDIKDYLESELTKTTIDIIRDTINDLIVNTDQIVTHKDPRIQGRMNRILNELNIIEHLKSDLPDIIYYGSYSYLIEITDKKGNTVLVNKKYKLRYLNSPSTTVSVYKYNRIVNYLVLDDDGNIYEMPTEKVFNISTNDFKLDLDHNDGIMSINSRDNSDELVSYDSRYLVGTPLFNNITFKVKEYILKEYLISILSIKDLIQPILLLVSLEKSTKTEEALDLTLEVENLINQNLDLSFIESEGLKVKELVATLIDNIRVLPDYDSKLGNMSELNLDKITDKIDKIRQDQKDTKEDIITALGLPSELFDGRATRWEAIKTSQRFNSKLNYYADNINRSVNNLIYSVLVSEYGKTEAAKLMPEIVVNLVNKSVLRDTTQSTYIESIKTSMTDISDLLDIYDRLAQSDIVDKSRLDEYFNTSFGKIDPNLKSIIKDTSKPEGSVLQK